MNTDTIQAMKSDRTVLWTKDFVLIIVINFLIFVNHIMILSTFPFYVEKIGGTEAQAGAAAFLFSFIAVICRPFIGWMLNNGKRKAILIIGIIGMLLMPIGYLAISVIFLAYIARMVHGASLACSNTTSSTIATDIIPKKRFAEGMGMFGMSTALATAIAPALGLYLMNYMGFTMMFAFAAISAGIAFLLFLILRVPSIEVARTPFSIRQLINKDSVPASAIALVFLLTFGALENFVAKFASDTNLPSGGIFFTIMACMLFFTRTTVGKIADRKGEGIFVYSCNASMFVSFLLLALIPNTFTFIIAAIFAGYGFGGLEPALQSMAVHIAPPEKRGSANSTFLCAYDIGIGVGGGLAGVLIQASGYSHMFLLLSLANVISVILYAAWGRKHPSAFLNAGLRK